MRQSSSNSTTERKNDLSNFYRESLNVKTRGNNAFKVGKFNLARKLYIDGLSRLMNIRNPSTGEALQLAGTLLSNYAACGLEVAKTQVPYTGMLSLKEVVEVCNIALANDAICQALSDAVLAKIRFRKDLASNRQPAVDPTILQRMDEIRGDNPCCHFDMNFNLRIFHDAKGATYREGDFQIKVELGKDAGEAAKGLECPVCGDAFATKLASKYVVRLQCQHWLCARCFLRWEEEFTDEETRKVTCVYCRQKVEKEAWDKALDSIVEKSSLETKLKFLPLDNRSERLE
eukprot:scaffold20092_cov85-Amphora_coffeaeformis.AAC.1